MPLAQRLLWLPNTATHHPESGARVQEQDTVLQIFFAQRTALLRLPLGVSADSGDFLGELPLLEEALDETPYSPAEVLGFAVMGEPVEAEVWLGAGVGTVSWDVYQAGMAHATLAAPPPTAEALRALPQVREAWLLAQTTGGYFSDEKGQPVLSQLTLLASPSGLVRSVNVGSELPEASELLELIFRGCAAPAGDLPSARPKVVLVADSAVADALGAGLQAVGVRSEVGDVSPALELLESLKGALAPDPIPPYFSAYPEGEVKAFFKAARAFFRAKPWERLGGTKFIAFRLADGPWHYANVMGQEGEAFGLATFGDWLEVCRTLNNVETLWERLSGLNQAETLPKSFLAAGGAESLSLCSLAELAPEDVTFLAELGVKPDRRQQLPAVQRFTPAGAAAPTLAPASYTQLLNILTERVQRARGDQLSSIKASLLGPDGHFEVRYPARGDEGASRRSYYGLRLPLHLAGAADEVLWADVQAPGETKWQRVVTALVKAVKTQPERFPWPTNLKHGEYLVWLDQAPVKEPSPTLEQLADLEGLSLVSYEHEDPLVLTPLPRPDDAKLTVVLQD